MCLVKFSSSCITLKTSPQAMATQIFLVPSASPLICCSVPLLPRRSFCCRAQPVILAI
uniref:Uncharacterized protein n=1 Tax=Timema poppense TaxID=170557 RepID=A0A7R9DMY6_TIMPO|nr:unnamed protein product [Timema poppensis]